MYMKCSYINNLFWNPWSVHSRTSQQYQTQYILKSLKVSCCMTIAHTCLPIHFNLIHHFLVFLLCAIIITSFLPFTDLLQHFVYDLHALFEVQGFFSH